jgi:DNA-binding MarR family transcriptional regulator
MSSETLFTQTLQDWSEMFMRHSFSEFKQFMDVHGLSPSQVITLFRLYHGGPCGVSAISHQLGVTNAAASQLIDRLVLMGYIARNEDQADRRAKQLSLTSNGRSILDEGIATRRIWMEGLTTQLTPEQQATVIAVLSVLTASASHIGEATGAVSKTVKSAIR